MGDPHWVRRSEGWSLTDRGRGENERRLAAELDEFAARSTVVEVHRRFLPLNARFQEAATRWQVRPLPGDSMAANDHTDFRWDDRVIESLRSVGGRLSSLEPEPATALPRFGGYAGVDPVSWTSVKRLLRPPWSSGVRTLPG